MKLLGVQVPTGKALGTMAIGFIILTIIDRKFGVSDAIVKRLPF